ncbi:zinc ribbon domain-containing protein [Streptomyces sp. AC602_WCS936]|uniref:RNA-guided endonuclease InsQ/TnpB family protein n=1 Tax=Streptomyces sp. AC602_WCS936 TaxID=2823685 RepID=UPI001C2653FF|nr:zinc ribbon domain-containing protein [Streptomyces sp. AC602_WCS936]
MKITAQVKLLPASAHDADALVATLRACNRAANAASQVAFAKDLKRRNVLQEAVYHRIKADFDLGAQAAVRTVKKVCDAYATFKANLRAGNYGPEGSKRRIRAESKPVRFRETSAQPFDDRMLTWNLDTRTVSVWTVAGRLKGIPFVCSPEAMRLLAQRKGESDLVMRDGMFFLIATIDIPEPEVSGPDGFLGVDLGIVNIATTSDGRIMSSRQVNRYRQRKRDLRGTLVFPGRDPLPDTGQVFQTDTPRGAFSSMHELLGDDVVALGGVPGFLAPLALEDTSRAFGALLLELARLHSWAFAQLGAFVEYKARRAGVAVVHVDPRNTSRQCSECWHTHRTNRVTQARFVCRSCGIVLHADHNGSRNIAHRADAAWQRGAVNHPRTP